MPYGHIKQYQQLVAEAERKRIQITRRQQQQIAKLYRDIASDMGKEIARKSERTLTYRWLKDYAKSLKGQSKQLYADLQGIVSAGILDTALAITGAEQRFWEGIAPGMSERFRDAFSSIPQTCVDELMNGGIYKDFAGLSERLWNYKGKFDRDIGYIIERGIIQQKSAYDLAKDLEMYVDPRAAKPWEWRKVYPNCNKVVDYNAQRLARTSVTHAYQLSFQRATRDNPFIDGYQWHSSNAGKTCDLCRKRDGKIFPKNRIPLDHPNGMCVITAVIPKSMDEIAGELSDWAAGRRNPELDRWMGKSERRLKDSEGVYETYNFSGNNVIKPRNIQNNLRLSDVGKETLEYLKDHPVPVKLYYGIDNPNNLEGEYDPIDDVIRIYVDKTKTVQRTAEVLIHEVTHQKYDMDNDQHAEAFCIMQEIFHRKQGKSLTSYEIRSILKLTRELYPELQWRKG